jgi:threonine dehydrogenase-like Zn-dependent dehydrogenase
MRAAVVQAPGDLAIAELPDPAPRDHEVVVAVELCGICGTDVHVLDGDYGVVRYPVIPGHEFGGEVVAVGRAARLLAAGALPVNLLHEPPLPLAATAQALERSRRGAGLKTRVQLRGDAS